MFGFIASPCARCNGNSQETSAYRGYFCGLANRLHADYGLPARMLVNRDSTFLSMLTAAQSDESPTFSDETCCNPLGKTRTVFQDENHAGYAAAVTVCGLSTKLLDEVDDSSAFRQPWFKIAHRIASPMTDRAIRFLNNLDFPVERVQQNIGKQTRLEQDIVAGHKNAELAGEPTASAFGEIFSHSNQRNSEATASLGRNLGRAIYWLDAAEDFDQDKKRNRFNPLPESKERNSIVEAKLQGYFQKMEAALSGIELKRYRPTLESILLDLTPKKAFGSLAFAAGGKRKNRNNAPINDSRWWHDCCDCYDCSSCCDIISCCGDNKGIHCDNCDCGDCDCGCPCDCS